MDILIFTVGCLLLYEHHYITQTSKGEINRASTILNNVFKLHTPAELHQNLVATIIYYQPIIFE